MHSRWDHLLFAHWTVDPELLQSLLPEPLELDTYNGLAFIGVIPFLMADVRVRYTPALPFVSKFLETNVRTYVRHGDAKGVYFFSLDASSLPAVETARLWFKLAYLNARMKLDHNGQWIRYEITRHDRRAPEAQFVAEYRPTSQARCAQPDSIEEFLVERYCLLTVHGKSVIRGDIHHRPWQLQPAEAKFPVNTMTSALSVELEGDPLLHFSESISTLQWAPVIVS
jgi:uncharacterized protein